MDKILPAVLIFFLVAKPMIDNYSTVEEPTYVEKSAKLRDSITAAQEAEKANK